MVCIQCGNKTQVINSRLQHRLNTVWRRRKCQVCSCIFSTIESTDYGTAWTVQKNKGTMEAFSRDKLYLSIFDSCKHRPNAIADATYITDSAIAKLRCHLKDGGILATTIFEVVAVMLNRFDRVASIHYQAFHKN